MPISLNYLYLSKDVVVRLKKAALVILGVFIITSCEQPNVLTEFSNTTSDEALYLEAKQKMNDFDWNRAISILTTELSADYRIRTEVKETLMHAYGGKCGILALDLIASLNEATSSKMFEVSLQIFGGQSVDTSACDNSFDTLMSISSDSTQRTSDQNLFAAILGLSKMATNIHVKFDTESSGLGDGVVDAGWDSCPDSTDPARLSDAEVKKIISGVGLIFENLTVLGSELTSGTASASLTDALNSCESVLGVGNCTIVDEAAVTPEVRRFFRRMISSSAVGYGTCDISDSTTPSCCPSIANP